jgi:hypothetical protein
VLRSVKYTVDEIDGDDEDDDVDDNTNNGDKEE